MSESDRQSRAIETQRQADEQDVQEVEKLFSTKQIRVRLKSREWAIPANYFSPKGKDDPDTLDVEVLAFRMFLPKYEGFDKNNWRKGWFDHNRINVLQLKIVDKELMVPLSGGGSEKITPANYGEPRAQFENTKHSLERTPTFEMYGLNGYRRINYPHIKNITWTGRRSNGEFLFFVSSLPPDEMQSHGSDDAMCLVRYYSEREDLYIAYNYFQEHIEKWRDIDGAIWTKLREWKAK